MSRPPTKPGLWWAAFDDGGSVTEVVLLEISFFSGQTSFDDGAVFRVIDGSGRDGVIDGDIRRPLIKPSWDIVLGCMTRAAVDTVRLTWLREQQRPKLPMAVGDKVTT